METKKPLMRRIITIPNILSLFRIALIPFIVWAYWLGSNYVAIGLIVLSGVTDVVDGIIARKFNMVSDLGKILDPIADKLTQGAVIICLTIKYKLMSALISLFALKETAMGILGLITIKKVGEVNGAKWYGKVNTVILYLVMGALVLFPNVPLMVANAMMIVCLASMIFSLIMYVRFYVKAWKSSESSK